MRREQAQWRLLVEAAARDAGCEACGSPAPSPECWLCGWSWLADVQFEYERDQAELERERAEVLRRLEEVAAAEARVKWLTGWVDRLGAVLEAHAAGRGRGRAVELLADLLARDAAAKATGRGRPSALAMVAAVLAADADWRAGRRALPGRAQTAELAGCVVRAVSSAWARAEALGWCVRTRQGRKLKLDERAELLRWRDRAEFDIAPLHRAQEARIAARAERIPAALRVYAELLDRVAGLLRQAQEDLDVARSRAQQVTDWDERARRGRLRYAVHRAQAAISGVIDRRSRLNICTPREASQGEYLSSCSLLGLSFARPIKITLPGSAAHRPRGGRVEVRASRSSTTGARGDLDSGGSQPTQLPRKPGVKRPRARLAPEWVRWAPALARGLCRRVPWLRRVDRVAATLGGSLASRPSGLGGDPWTAELLLDRIAASRGGRPLLDWPDNPLSYLRHLIQALPAADRRVELAAADRHALHRAQAAALRARKARRDAEHAARQAARRSAESAKGRVARGIIAWHLANRGSTEAPAGAGVAESCAGGCQTHSPDVEIRLTPRPVPLCPACWDTIR